MSAAGTLLAVLLTVVLPFQAGAAEDRGPIEVQVNNFPETQKVKGAVSIDGVVSHAKYLKKEGIVVPVSRRGEPAEMAHAGTIETDGFTSIVISLQGEIRSDTFTPGTVGVLLVPDEAPVLRALREARQVQFPVESAAKITSGGSPNFSAEQVRQSIAFPRYNIFLYNTLNRTVDANVYLQLLN
jgi:hypothetical protein